MFIALLLMTRAGVRSSYRRMLERFVDETAAFLDWDETPSASGFSQARKRLSVAQCRGVLASVIERISACSRARFRHASGRRFIALDGTQLIMPRVPETLSRFARPKANSWLSSHFPQAVTLIAVDLFKQLPLEWRLLKKGIGEREGALGMLELFKPGDVAVLDRGFPSRDFLQSLMERRIDVVMRMPVGERSIGFVRDFVDSGARSTIAAVDFADGSRVSVRLVRRNFRIGRPRVHQKAKPMVVLTTLKVEDGFADEEILRLYTARWGVETVLREIKCEFDVERFHARSIQGVEQELAAVMVWIALASGLQQLAEEGLAEDRRVMRNLCFDIAARLLGRVLSGEDLWATLDRRLDALRRFSAKVRPGRSYPRERKSPLGRFSPS